MFFKDPGGSPAAQETYIPGPGPGNSPVYYEFYGLYLACAGPPAVGICVGQSRGQTTGDSGEVGAISGLQGDIWLTCTIGGCDGVLGGPIADSAPGGLSPVVPDEGGWSYVNGPYMVGSLEDIRCGGGPGGGEGLFAFSRVPWSWPELVHTDHDGVPDQIWLSYTDMTLSGVIIMTVPVNA